MPLEAKVGKGQKNTTITWPLLPAPFSLLLIYCFLQTKKEYAQEENHPIVTGVVLLQEDMVCFPGLKCAAGLNVARTPGLACRTDGGVQDQVGRHPIPK